jgi:hypothetical protein
MGNPLPTSTLNIYQIKKCFAYKAAEKNEEHSFMTNTLFLQVLRFLKYLEKQE